MTHGGGKIGGINVFGGGSASTPQATKSSVESASAEIPRVADHNIAWRVRNILNLDHLAAGDGLPQ